MESHFEELLASRFECIWKLLGRDIPSTSVDVWHWCFAVIDAYETSIDDDPSIERIYQKLVDSGARYLPTTEEKRYILQAMFAVLCWTSATLKPVLGTEAIRSPRAIIDPDASDEETDISVASTALLAENCLRTFSSTDLRRPTSKMFNSYRVWPHNTANLEPEYSGIRAPDIATQAPSCNLEDVLHEPSLNYGSLSTISRVRIKWVDTLTAHLAFDRATRELSVYRYPSFCVAKILSKHKVKVLERYVHKIKLTRSWMSWTGLHPV